MHPDDPEDVDEPIEPLGPEHFRFETALFTFTVRHPGGMRIDHAVHPQVIRRYLVIETKELRGVLDKPRRTEMDQVERPADREWLERAAQTALQSLAEYVTERLGTGCDNTLVSRALPGQTIEAQAATSAIGKLVHSGPRTGVAYCIELLTDEGELRRVVGTRQLLDALASSGAITGDRIQIALFGVHRTSMLELAIGADDQPVGEGGQPLYTVEKLETHYEQTDDHWTAYA